MRVKVMRELLAHKFVWPVNAEPLEATRGSILIEGNTWGDQFWGVCRGRGENMLGRLLMDIRGREGLALHTGILSARR